MEPNIIFEDNHIVVAIKPQNVPSQADASGDEDFFNMIKEYIRQKYDKQGNVFLGLIHRLDRPTGGIMIFAKTSKAASRLSEQMRQGEIIKQYLAVVVNRPRFAKDRLTHYLKKDEKNNIVTIAPALAEGSKIAVLDYKTLETTDNTNPIVSLVDVMLHTGRSHQVRVQMQAIGNPLYGDLKYGTTKGKNLALFAYSLKFMHPVTKDNLKFVVYPPDDVPWNLFNVGKYIEINKPRELY